jgi:hypothetical protein
MAVVQLESWLDLSLRVSTSGGLSPRLLEAHATAKGIDGAAAHRACPQTMRTHSASGVLPARAIRKSRQGQSRSPSKAATTLSTAAKYRLGPALPPRRGLDIRTGRSYNRPWLRRRDWSFTFVHEGGHHAVPPIKASQALSLDSTKRGWTMTPHGNETCGERRTAVWPRLAPLFPDDRRTPRCSRQQRNALDRGRRLVARRTGHRSSGRPGLQRFRQPLPHRWVNNGFEDWSPAKRSLPGPSGQASLHLTADPLSSSTPSSSCPTAPSIRASSGTTSAFEPMTHLANGHKTCQIIGDLKVLASGREPVRQQSVMRPSSL